MQQSSESEIINILKNIGRGDDNNFWSYMKNGIERLIDEYSEGADVTTDEDRRKLITYIFTGWHVTRLLETEDVHLNVHKDECII